MSTMPVHVSICISTYKRPEGLAKLLDGIHNLEFHQVEPPVLEVLVADNDAAGSAREICDHARTSFPGSLIYAIEPQQGVSYARNRTVVMASKSADFIAFIDDDEVPEPLWLDGLLAAQQQYAADIVAGPVYPQFQDDTIPKWVERGEFFAPPSHQTGAVLNAAFTNNVLVKAVLVRQLDVVFDPRFAIKGAEDTYFFMRLRKMGATIVWTNEAIVHEAIPSSRTTLGWLLERGFWGWSSYSLFEKELFPSFKGQVTRFLKGIVLIFAGMLASLPSLFLGRHRLYKAVLNIYRGVGTISGLAGIQGDW
ncbi:MAG: glycosyltransferase family 2 protein [Nodosilinea sp.]